MARLNFEPHHMRDMTDVIVTLSNSVEKRLWQKLVAGQWNRIIGHPDKWSSKSEVPSLSWYR